MIYINAIYKAFTGKNLFNFAAATKAGSETIIFRHGDILHTLNFNINISEENKKDFVQKAAKALCALFEIEPARIYINMIELNEWGVGENFF